MARADFYEYSHGHWSLHSGLSLVEVGVYPLVTPSERTYVMHLTPPSQAKNEKILIYYSEAGGKCLSKPHYTQPFGCGYDDCRPEWLRHSDCRCISPIGIHTALLIYGQEVEMRKARL